MTQSQESTVKPLFGFRALMADLADWIREHRMTLGFVLFITLFNVGMQLVCGMPTYAISAAIVAREF